MFEAHICMFCHKHTHLSVADKPNTARWLIRSDVSGTLIHAKDVAGNTPAHDAADYGYERWTIIRAGHLT